MPQVTIYVPQDLADALDRQRDRLNVSQVCAQALRKEVGMLDAMVDPAGVAEGPGEPGAIGVSGEPVDEMAALIERLRLQKQRSLEHADEVERARRRADGWIRKAHYEQLKHFGEIEPAPDGVAGVDAARFYADALRLTPHEEEATREWGRQRTRDGLGFSLAAYRRAWHEHVRGFWLQIKDQL